MQDRRIVLFNSYTRIAACRAALAAMRERYPSLARQVAGLTKAAAAAAR